VTYHVDASKITVQHLIDISETPTIRTFAAVLADVTGAGKAIYKMPFMDYLPLQVELANALSDIGNQQAGRDFAALFVRRDESQPD